MHGGSKRPVNGAESSTVARQRKVLEDLSPIKEKARWNREALCGQDARRKNCQSKTVRSVALSKDRGTLRGG